MLTIKNIGKLIGKEIEIKGYRFQIYEASASGVNNEYVLKLEDVGEVYQNVYVTIQRECEVYNEWGKNVKRFIVRKNGENPLYFNIDDIKSLTHFLLELKWYLNL